MPVNIEAMQEASKKRHPAKPKPTGMSQSSVYRRRKKERNIVWKIVFGEYPKRHNEYRSYGLPVNWNIVYDWKPDVIVIDALIPCREIYLAIQTLFFTDYVIRKIKPRKIQLPEIVFVFRKEKTGDFVEEFDKKYEIVPLFNWMSEFVVTN